MNRHRLTAALAVLSAAVLAGCEPAGDYVFSPDDCEGVPFRTSGAWRAGLDDWGLRYAAVCPTIAVALGRCERLSDPAADPDGFVDCVRENVEMAPESCPDRARAAFLEAFRDSRLHVFCLADHRGRVHDAAIAALEAHSDGVPAGVRGDLAWRCAQESETPAQAERCADDAAERHIAAAERGRAIRLALAAALDEHADAWPPGRRDDVEAHCRSGDGPDEAAECVAEAAGLFRAAGEAVAGVPEDQRGPILDDCLKSGRTAHRALAIADPGCAAEDARALDALGRYAQDAVDRCRARNPRWSEAFACARRAWFTRGRVAETAESGPLPEATARLRPDFLGPAVANYCGRWVPSRASARTRWLEPFEHPADGVARLVESCVDSEASALLGIRRAAGTTYAAPFERCARRAPELMGNQHWPYVATCVGDAARKAGDARFADALRACAKSGEDATMAACPASADG